MRPSVCLRKLTDHAICFYNQWQMCRNVALVLVGTQASSHLPKRDVLDSSSTRRAAGALLGKRDRGARCATCPVHFFPDRRDQHRVKSFAAHCFHHECMWFLRRYLLPSRAFSTLSAHTSYRPVAVRRLSRIAIPEKMEIRLTESEGQLCALLDECTTWMKEEKGMETSCRIAGGWVRDKVGNTVLPVMGLCTPRRFRVWCSR